jgi:hypothetical protein
MTAPMDCRLIGRWRIVESDLWDRDHLDLVEPAMINPRPRRMPAHLAQRCPDGHDLLAARRQRLTFQYHDPVVDAPDPPLAAGDVSPCNVVGPRMISGPAAAAAGRSGSVTWLAHVAGPRPPGPGQPAGRRARSARGGSTAHGSRRGRTSLRDLEPWPRSTCTRSCSRGFCPSPMSSTAPDPPAWAMRPCACQRSSTSSCTSSPTAISDILAMLSVGSRCGIAWKPRPCCAGHRRASWHAVSRRFVTAGHRGPLSSFVLALVWADQEHIIGQQAHGLFQLARAMARSQQVHLGEAGDWLVVPRCERKQRRGRLFMRGQGAVKDHGLVDDVSRARGGGLP